MTSSTPPLKSSADTFNGDIESQSIRHSLSSSEIARESDRDEELGGEREKKLTLAEKGEADPYPDAINAVRNEIWDGSEEKGGAVTRMSTKSSWKDPGPPPDGGWIGWTQGM